VNVEAGGAGNAPPAADSASPTEPPAAPDQPKNHGLVRNTLYLTLAQVVTIPLSVASNAISGRYLGPEEFGYMYTAATLCAFAILALEWGHQGAIPALVARDRSRAAAILGTSFAWRALAAVPITLVIAGICVLLDYPPMLRWAVALTLPLTILVSFGGGLKDTIRGFERTDIPAKAHVAQQTLMVLIIIPVLLLGGHLRSILLSHTFIAIVMLLYLLRALRPLTPTPLRIDRAAFSPLLRLGTPFVFFGLAMAAQPSIDATFLAKLTPPQVAGWYAVAQRLIGLLIFPASALISALYPTLCRLESEDKAEFVRVTRSSLYGVSLLAFPAAVGCALFPELGVMIFGREKFGGAEMDLRVLSIFLFLVYFSMPLGTAVLAANRQKAWAGVQCICIVVSVFFNPLLIPYFQRTYGNGSLGTCWGVVLGEALIVAAGIALTPRGLFDRGLMKSLLLSAVAGAVMAGLALLTKPISLFLAVPLSVAGYGVVAWLTGALQRSTIDMVKGFFVRKFSRAR
jgi:O-antigen/teichoic acid export membrane protein